MYLQGKHGRSVSWSVGSAIELQYEMTDFQMSIGRNRIRGFTENNGISSKYFLRLK